MELLSVSAQKFYIFAGSDGYCGHRIFCRHRIDAGVLRNQLFQTAQHKGWYQVEQAPASKVSTAYTKFSNQAPQ